MLLIECHTRQANYSMMIGGWAAPGNDIERDEADDPVQESDIPLAWMITALMDIGKEDPNNCLKFNDSVDIFLKNFNEKQKDAELSPLHDPLKLGGGLPWYKAVGWKVMGIVSASE